MAKEGIDLPAPHIQEPLLQGLGILSPEQQMQSTRIIYDNHGSDGWIYGYRVEAFDLNTGELSDIYFKGKHMLSLAEEPTARARHHANKTRALQELGIPVPHTYGAQGGALYQSFIVHEDTQAVFHSIRTAQNIADVRAPLDQLIDMAAKLDGSTFEGKGFLGNLLHDADTETFVYNDVGSDLGMSEVPNNDYGARDCLRRSFERHQEYIYYRYNQMSQQIYPQAA